MVVLNQSSSSFSDRMSDFRFQLGVRRVMLGSMIKWCRLRSLGWAAVRPRFSVPSRWNRYVP